MDEGYSAIVAAAAKLATSAIVDRRVREKAQSYLEAEIDRWDERPFEDDESQTEGPDE